MNVTCISPDAVATPMFDLQKDYEEAAITFSGSKPLSAADIADIVIDTIGNKKWKSLLLNSEEFRLS